MHFLFHLSFTIYESLSPLWFSLPLLLSLSLSLWYPLLLSPHLVVRCFKGFLSGMIPLVSITKHMNENLVLWLTHLKELEVKREWLNGWYVCGMEMEEGRKIEREKNREKEKERERFSTIGSKRIQFSRSPLTWSPHVIHLISWQGMERMCTGSFSFFSLFILPFFSIDSSFSLLILPFFSLDSSFFLSWFFLSQSSEFFPIVRLLRNKWKEVLLLGGDEGENPSLASCRFQSRDQWYFFTSCSLSLFNTLYLFFFSLSLWYYQSGSDS